MPDPSPITPGFFRERLPWAVTDATTMVVRSLRLSTRNVDGLITSLMLPVMLMLVFVFLFGGAIETGTSYVNYVVPGVILLSAAFGSAMTAVSISADLSTSIIDRFRSMAIVPSSVLFGHVVASLVRNLASTAIVIGVAIAIGFRPSAGPIEWLAAIGLLSLFILAMSWFSAAIGILARTPDAASGFTFVALFLPYVSSAFVPVETMPTWLRAFAETQPVTPMIEAVRGLLTGTEIGSSGISAVAWWGGIALVFCALAAWLYRRRRD
jgi:ABC-2 type transport system permease protein